jgi:hypothetical protein
MRSTGAARKLSCKVRLNGTRSASRRRRVARSTTPSPKTAATASQGRGSHSSRRKDLLLRIPRVLKGGHGAAWPRRRCYTTSTFRLPEGTGPALSRWIGDRTHAGFRTRRSGHRLSPRRDCRRSGGCFGNRSRCGCSGRWSDGRLPRGDRARRRRLSDLRLRDGDRLASFGLRLLPLEGSARGHGSGDECGCGNGI